MEEDEGGRLFASGDLSTVASLPGEATGEAAGGRRVGSSTRVGSAPAVDELATDSMRETTGRGSREDDVYGVGVQLQKEDSRRRQNRQAQKRQTRQVPPPTAFNFVPPFSYTTLDYSCLRAKDSREKKNVRKRGRVRDFCPESEPRTRRSALAQTGQAETATNSQPTPSFHTFSCYPQLPHSISQPSRSPATTQSPTPLHPLSKRGPLSSSRLPPSPQHDLPPAL